MKKGWLSIVLSVTLMAGECQITKAVNIPKFARAMMKISTNTSVEGRSAFFFAVSNGDINAAEYCLKDEDKDIDVNEILDDENKCTALHIAVIKEDTQMVDFLLNQSDIKVLKRDLYGKTALHYAAQKGNREIVIKLLRKNIKIINDVDKESKTALHYAIEQRQENIAEDLLKAREIRLDIVDKYGRTPIYYAVHLGLEETVKNILLLCIKDRNAVTELHKAVLDNNLEFVEGYDKQEEGIIGVGITPLHFAACIGNLKTAEVLLNREDINSYLKAGGALNSALLTAGYMGNLEIVQMMLDYENMNNNARSRNGSTVLYEAVRSGNEEIVDMLLKRSDTIIDAGVDSGRTLLHEAALHGHLNLVNIFLARGDINKNAKDSHGFTALHLAVHNGHDEVVKLLLGRDDIDKQIVNEHGETILNTAARKGHLNIVRMLLERDDVAIDARNNYGFSVLYAAASGGNEKIVEELLKRKDIVIDAENDRGLTALHIAAANGHEKVVKLLLEIEEIEKNAVANRDCMALHMAAMFGHKQVVRLLLEDVGVEINAKTLVHGRTALYIAVDKGFKGVVQTLLRRTDLDKDAKNNDGETALHLAVKSSKKELVELLLKAGARQDIEDARGLTPLFYAANRKSEEIKSLLLRPYGIKSMQGFTELHRNCALNRDLFPLKMSQNVVNAVDANGETALHIAAKKEDVYKMSIILSTGGIDVNKKNNDGQEVIDIIVQRKNLIMLRTFIDNMFDFRTYRINPDSIRKLIEDDSVDKSEEMLEVLKNALERIEQSEAAA